MAQQYRCDAPGCQAPARWMETDMQSGQVHTWCDGHHSTTTLSPAPDVAGVCDMDDCYEAATVLVKDLSTGETERFCHLHYIDFVMGLALKIGEEAGLLPPDGPIPAGEAPAFPGTENVVRRGRAAAKRRERQRAQEAARAEAVGAPAFGTGSEQEEEEPDPRSVAHPVDPSA